MFFKDKKQKNTETYLTYLNGDIYEEERTRRKELHEDTNPFLNKSFDKDITETDLMKDHQNTEAKMKQHSPVKFFSNRLFKFIFTLLFIVLIITSINVLSTYTMSVFGPKNEVTTESIKELNENDLTIADETTKNTKSTLFEDVKETFTSYLTRKEPDSPKVNQATKGEFPKLSDNSAENLLLSTEIHESTIQTTEELKGYIMLFTSNRSNRVSLNSKAQTIGYKLQSQMTELEESINDDEAGNIYEMKQLLLKRLENLSGLTSSIQNIERSEMIPTANELITIENNLNGEYQHALKDTLTIYGVPYTETKDKLIF